MKIQRSYKVELKPNNRQKSIFIKSIGVARFSYNWGLAERKNAYQQKEKTLTAIDLSKKLNAIKKEQFPWMYDVSKSIPQESFRNLEKAFKNFFRGFKSEYKIGFPKFKSKHNNRQYFHLSSDRFYVTQSSIKLSKIGQIKLKEKRYIPTENVHYNSVTVSKQAGRWYVSVQCEIDVPKPKKPEALLGIDVGIKTLATCSNGQVFENNKYLQNFEKKLSHAQRSLSRKVKESNNRQKSKKRVQKIYQSISNKRKDQIHKMTSTLVKTKPRYFALEDLNIQGMIKNHSLAKSLSDASFGEIKRQFLYKTLWYGGEIVDVDRFYPSSKTCSVCGNIKQDLTLGVRTYICNNCGHVEDRDLNAAKNLENFGISTLSSRGIEACGESVRPVGVLEPVAVSGSRKRTEL